MGRVIRNVVLGRLKPEHADDPAVDAALAAIDALDLPGKLSSRVGRDVGLRAGGWSFAITNDWADADAYRAYDADPEHNVHRGVLVEHSEQVARVQFEVPDAG